MIERPHYVSEDEWQEFLRHARKPKPAEHEPRARRKPLNGERKAAGRIDQALNNKRAETPPWMRDACFDHKGALVPNVASAMAALRSAPQISRCFAFDKMMRAPVIVNHIPGEPDETIPRPLTDDDVTLLQEWLQNEAGLLRIGQRHNAPSRRFESARVRLSSAQLSRSAHMGPDRTSRGLARLLSRRRRLMPRQSAVPLSSRLSPGYSIPVASRTTC